MVNVRLLTHTYVILSINTYLFYIYLCNIKYYLDTPSYDIELL